MVGLCGRYSNLLRPELATARCTGRIRVWSTRPQLPTTSGLTRSLSRMTICGMPVKSMSAGAKKCTTCRGWDGRLP
jgi:hypothetical protein